MHLKIIWWLFSHCSHLDIYILQKIRLYEGDFEGKFQTSVHASIMNFWSKNSDLLHSFSFYFLQELSNPLFFVHCCYYSNDLTCLSCKNVKQFNLFEIAVTAVDLTTPAKNRRKMSVIHLNFQVKKFMILACTLVWNLPSKSPDFLWNVNDQINTVCIRASVYCRRRNGCVIAALLVNIWYIY